MRGEQGEGGGRGPGTLAFHGPGGASLSSRRRGSAVVLVCAAALGAALATSAAHATAPSTHGRSPGARSRRSVLIVFAAAGERELASVSDLSVGLMSAAQGTYSRTQLLLDLTQGARVATSAYATAAPAPIGITAAGAAAYVDGWPAARARAEGAPQLLEPGLLAASVPGGAGYVGAGGSDLDALVAAGRAGRIAAFSVGSPATLLARTAALEREHSLLVVDLAPGSRGLDELRALTRERAPGELMIVLQRAPATPAHELLWSAAAGLSGGGGRELSSQSTNERGLIASFDVAPTALEHLGLALPSDIRGKPIATDGPLQPGALRALKARLQVIGGRRLKALGFLLAALAAMLVGAACWPRAQARARARARALRVCGLGVLWAPVVVLIPAALEPSAAAEYALIAGACIALGALTDALLPWPRGPLAPAIAAIVVLGVDALAGTQLLMRSLLGPDPILGARFYGIGNELKSGLAVLVAAAAASALYPARRGRRAVLCMAAAGAVLAVLEGSARLGAGVGGVILVSFGFALAASLLAPGARTRRRTVIVLCTPVTALVALAALDLATAHGAGHFTGSILHARSAGDLRDVLVRRYRAAWQELRNHVMPLATAAALAVAVLAVRRRERLLAVVNGDPAWSAALAGGLAAGVLGSLVEDSGPVLLLVAVFALGCVLSYLRGNPRLLGAPPGHAGRAARPSRRAG